MGIIDQISRSAKGKGKELKMKQRKQRQKKHLKKAQKSGNTKAVAKYKGKIASTNKKRKKASKEFGRGAGQALKAAGESAAKAAIQKAVMFV